jgi:alcohol dehydrogenase/L-iditol 2-dehydrogenase
MWTGEQSWEVDVPVVLGHEYAGVIGRVGEAVRGWQVGDRVTGETAARIDPQNPLAREGWYNLDPTRLGFGARIDGAMRGSMPVPQRILHRVPDELPFEKAALTEPCCVAYNAVVHNSNILPGQRVLVIGPGPIGLLCAAVAKLRGAEVAVCGLPVDQVRLEVAKAYGCAPIVGDPRAWSMDGDGFGVDCVIDAAGVSATLKTAIDCTRPRGWITKVGWGSQPMDFNLDPLVQKNITLQGSFSHTWSMWERVIKLLAEGSLDVNPILGGVWPLTEWETAFRKMHDGEVVKSVVTPG